MSAPGSGSGGATPAPPPAPAPKPIPATGIHTDPPPAGHTWAHVGSLVVAQPVNPQPVIVTTTGETDMAKEEKGGGGSGGMPWWGWLIIAGGVLFLGERYGYLKAQDGGFRLPPGRDAQTLVPPPGNGGAMCNPCASGYARSPIPGKPCWCKPVQ
jgi:hypothetical protein